MDPGECSAQLHPGNSNMPKFIHQPNSKPSGIWWKANLTAGKDLYPNSFYSPQHKFAKIGQICTVYRLYQITYLTFTILSIFYDSIQAFISIVCWKCLFDDSIKGVTDIMNRLNILFSLHSFHASDHFNLCVYPTYLWGYSGSWNDPMPWNRDIRETNSICALYL